MNHFVSYLEILSFFINKGGPVNIVISVLYLLWITILLEKSVFFLLTRFKNIQLLRKVSDSFNSSDEESEAPKNFFHSLRQVSRNLSISFSQKGSGYFISRVEEGLGKGNQSVESILTKKEQQKWKNAYLLPLLNKYLTTVKLGEKRLTNVLEDQGEKTINRMERGLWILSELGHIAPLMGLLGTVIGLINAFGTISEKGAAVEVSDLAAGIWVAMLTTANGLILALLSFLTFKVFDRLIKRRESYMSQLVSVLDFHYNIGRSSQTDIEPSQPINPVQDSI